MNFPSAPRFLAALLVVTALAQAQDASLPVETSHPRLFLTAPRLKRLRRERERQTLRWVQFHLLMAGKAPMAEPGFADALYYQVAGDAQAGARAVAWALGPATDLRQLALVFDWCQDLFSTAQSKALAEKLTRGIQRTERDQSVSAVRARVLAAIALGGHDELEQAVRGWWDGHPDVPLDEGYALFEMLHAVRDNLDIDLRESTPEFFRELPAAHLLRYYPAAYPAPENEFRIPASLHPTAEPDLRRAALWRATELSMVAYDSNAPGSQFLQGWLMNDNFLMRGTFGAPYEFLWANPYQPGLSYEHVPPVLHETAAGRLFVRSNWDESAAWFGLFEGELQLFEDGRVKLLDANQTTQPVDLGAAFILLGGRQSKFTVSLQNNEPVFVVGLKPQRRYAIEVDDEEMTEGLTDRGGTLELDLAPGSETGVRLREAP